MSDPIQATLQACAVALRTNRLGDAEALARASIKQMPKAALAWKLLGAVLLRRGERAGAIDALEMAAKLAPQDAEVQCNLAGALVVAGRHAEAKVACAHALNLVPDYAEAHGNLGTALLGLGDAENAETSQRRAIALKPYLAEAHSNLGNALKARGQLDEAERCYRHALTLKPDLVEAAASLGFMFEQRGDYLEAERFFRQALRFNPQDAHLTNALGNTLLELGQLSDAEDCYRRAVTLMPDFAEAFCNLGNLLHDRGRLQEALAFYQRAIAQKPQLVTAYCHLARALAEIGDYEKAEQCYRHAFETKPDFQAARAGYVELLARKRFVGADEKTSRIVARALVETWINPMKLARSACELLKLRLGPDRDCVEPALPSLVDRLSTEPLATALLRSTPVIDEELETIFTRVRQWFLDTQSTASEPNEASMPLKLASAMAQQCFINEYVYALTSEEEQNAAILTDKLLTSLDSDAPIAPASLAIIACYLPLHSLKGANRLLARQWPESLYAVLRQQIEEPLFESGIHDSIPRLTVIGEGVSSRVRQQYEENPYPRWTNIPKMARQSSPGGYFKRKFPDADVPDLASSRPLEVLIAGCGTGLHAITAARRYGSARVLAIDLSMKSLAFAKRKTIEMDVQTIDYAQADITEMASLDRSFDIVETSGVLHHLADPFAGWRTLLSLLRSGGLMKIGLYSEIGRRHIVAMQEIARVGSEDRSPEAIREARQRLRDTGLASPSGEPLLDDFYSTSACRDLLFHEQEHRFDLSAIDRFLKDHDLRPLGFEIDPAILRGYRKRFPDDRAATSLDQWQIFENENPRTFTGMYQFWIGKRPS